MKIGMVVNNLAVSGGYQKLVLRLAHEFEKLGHPTTIFTLQVDREACYPNEIDSATIVAPPDEQRPESDGWRRLAQVMPSDLDALILHDEAGLAVLLHLSTRPRRTVWMLNNELDVLARTMSFRDVLRRRTDRRTYRSWRRLRAAARRIDAFGVYDGKNASAVREHLGREPSLVYAGADVEHFEPIQGRRSPRLPTDPLHVVSVGVAFPHRRYEDLIDALTLVSAGVEVRLTIVGLHTFHPQYAASLRERVAEQELGDRVSFVEYLDAPALDDLYAGADVFAFVNDGLTWGIAVFEAVAAGLPLVVSTTAGAADLLVDGRHAWLVPPRAPSAVAAAFDAIAAEPNEARRRVAAANAEVLDLVRWSSFAARIAALSKDVER